MEVLQEGDGYDGSAFVADLLSIGGPHEEEAQVRAALPSATATATLRVRVRVRGSGARLALGPSPNTYPIQVRYHAFNESEDSDVKLVDTVAVRRLHRARAHPTPALAGFTRP